MKLLYGTGIVLYTGMLLADITDEMIARTLEWRRDGHEIKRGGPLDVRLGRVMRASGFLGATRYYVPEIKTASEIKLDANNDIKWKREYIKDQAAATGEGKSLPPPEEGNAARYKERYYQTMIYMFPSVGGSVDIGTGEGDSLVRFLNSQDEGSENKKSPKILAALMAMGLGAKLDGGDAGTSEPIKTKKNEGKNDIKIRHREVVDVSVNLRKFPSVRNIVRFLEAGVEYEFNSSDEEFHLLSKGPLLHAFIHYYFNKYEELRSFIDAFYEIVKGDEKMLKACFTKESDAENRDSEAFSGIYKVVTDPKSLDIIQTIPFTPTAPQIQVEEAYFYNRGTGEFRRGDRFGSCVETALLSSLYCLFFDPLQQKCRLKKELVESLEKAELELRRELAGKFEGEELELKMRERLKRLEEARLVYFFKDYPSPGAMDKARKERWVETVEDLGDERIVYCKHRTDDEGHVYRGELCTGLINFLRVVVKISGLDGSEYLSGFADYREKPSEEDEKRIIEEFKEQFEKAMSRLCDKEVTISYPYGLKMEKVGRSDDDLGWDITGSVEFNMRDEVGRNGRFTLVQQDIHTKLEVRGVPMSIPEGKLNELRRDIDGIVANTGSQLDIHLQYAFAYFMTDVLQFDEYFREFYQRLVNSPIYYYLGLLAFAPLQNDEQKMAMLRKLFPDVVGTGNSYKEQLVENILNSLALNVEEISSRVHPLVAFNTHFREKYAAILERHAVPPGGIFYGFRQYWMADNQVRKQCILLYYDKPELLMFQDGVDIAETIAQYEDCTELREVVRQIPDAGMRSVINASGVAVACKHGKAGLGQYFLGELEIVDDAVLEAEALYYIHYYLQNGDRTDFNPVTKFFTDQVGTASDETIRKMYSWCFDSMGVHCAWSDVLPFIRATYKRVGQGFVFDQVMRMRDFDRMENYSPKNRLHVDINSLWGIVRAYPHFYKSLIKWVQAEGIELRQDVYGLIKGYIELMEHESQVEGSKYFKGESADKIEEFRGELVELKSLLEKVARSSDSDNKGPEHGDAASPTFGTEESTQ